MTKTDLKVNKEELIELVSKLVELDGAKSTKKMARAYTDAVFSAIHAALAEGKNVAVQGHGVYENRERSARTGRNPQTGEAIQIEATKTVGFRPTGIKSVVK